MICDLVDLPYAERWRAAQVLGTAHLGEWSEEELRRGCENDAPWRAAYRAELARREALDA